MTPIIFYPNPPIKSEQVYVILKPNSYDNDFPRIEDCGRVLFQIKCDDGVVLVIILHGDERRK